MIKRYLLGPAGLKGDEADSGVVTLIQRFGSATRPTIACANSMRTQRSFKNVKLGEKKYSPPFIFTKPEKLTLFALPAAGLSHSFGSL